MPNDDLISRKALIEVLSKKLMVDVFPNWKDFDFDMQHNICILGKAVKREIEAAPTVDAEPVHKKPLIASIMETMNHMDENTKNGGHQSNTARRGKWILFGKNHAKCSECKLKRNISTQVAWEYCPKCGTIMDFEEDTPCTP